jgi:hypothetical protein
MIKKPADLKLAFRNGALPDQEDFGNLIDSFVPRDAVGDADLAALREMAVWWRARAQDVPDPLPPAGPPARPSAPVAPAAPDATPADPAGNSTVPDTPAVPGPSVVIVRADGNWTLLPLTAGQDGAWNCSAATLRPRRGYTVIGNAIAFVTCARPHLVQNMVRDSVLPWNTLQFAWREEEGTGQYRLALRSRRAFGADTTGADALIRCTIALQSTNA